MAKNKSKNPQPKASELKIIQSKVSKPNAPTSKSSKSAPIANHPAPAQNADQSVRRAEIVALLDILSRKLPTAATLVQVPEDLSENTPESTRQMSYEQEDRLVKELAFLSGISDNPNHIMAVCIQEFPKEGGCGILLAVNKSSPDTADPVLEKAQRGFQRIFDRLREISPTSSFERKRAVREAVFNQIVAVSRERILSRMRSSKYNASGYKSQKCFIGLHLREALQSPWRLRARKHKLNMTEQDLEMHENRIRSLLATMETFEASDYTTQKPQEQLASLIKKISHFKQRTPLRDLLATLTETDMQKSSRDRLLSCLEKLARYRQVSKFLCQEAEVVSRLRNVTVTSVKLPAAAYLRPTQAFFSGTVFSTLEELSDKEQPFDKSSLPLWLRIVLESIPDAVFASGINQNLWQSKIHAEIQILAHYESTSADILRPRIIAASKDACYLCHTFFRLHGQFRVPKTHGKLYRSWWLPTTPTLQPLQESLNAVLEKQVRETLKTLRKKKGFPIVKHPNESTLFSLGVSASLLSSMKNLSIVSNHSRLDLTTITEPIMEAPTQISYTALGTRVSNIRLQSLDAIDNGEPEPRIVDQGSGGDQRSQSRTITPKPAQEDDSIPTMDESPALRGGVKDYEFEMPAQSSSPFRNLAAEISIHHAGSKSVKTSSIRCSQAEPLEGSVAPSGPVSEHGAWFRYKNLDLYFDGSSAKFSHDRLKKSEALVAVGSSDADHIFDLRFLPIGAEITLPKDVDDSTYFACGDETFKISTQHIQ